jgi:two-component system chemotaxis sensor kinase CheA
MEKIMTDSNPAFQTFSHEVEELLTEMEDALLALEETPDDLEQVNSVFRAMHTIKGSSGLFGFDDIVAFTHHAETVLDHVRNGDRVIDPELISVLLACKDHTAHLVNYFLSNETEPLTEALKLQSDALIAQLKGPQHESVNANSLPVSQQEKTGSVEIELGNADARDNWVISLDFKEDALRNGMDPLSFIRYLATLGTIVEVIVSLTPEITIETIEPESCYLSFKIAFNSNADKQTIENVFEFAAEDCVIHILPPYSHQELYLQLLENQPNDHLQRLGEMLVEIGALTNKEVSEVLSEQQDDMEHAEKPIGERLLEKNIVQQPIVEQALKKTGSG